MEGAEGWMGWRACLGFGVVDVYGVSNLGSGRYISGVGYRPILVTGSSNM